ncbi:MAG: serine/threonine-protein phosphatase [Phycisphaerae bacterium]|nr:serine/threonine-protein phosphatase [Phycisphaerae bacterium]
MHSRPIIFSASPGLSGASARWLSPVRVAWPCGDAPMFEAVDGEAFFAELSRAEGRERLPGAVIAVFGPTDAPWRIDIAAEALRAAHLPGILLLPDPSPWRSFQRGGVLFESIDTPPPVLAAILYGLLARQADVDLLEREVGLTRRCERSIRDEMDRLHEELHLAASIQREFTSCPLPKIPGLSFGVMSRPVSFVSGDVCCLRDAGEDRLAFLLADAAGHGVPAALLTMVLTHALTTHEAAGGGGVRLLEPAEVLSRLNRRLCEHCRGSAWFATAVYGVLDARTRALKVASAGHPRPLVVGPTNAREIDAQGPVLGLLADGEFCEAATVLEADETLLLYTDGLESVFADGAPARGTGVDPAAVLREVHAGGADPVVLLGNLERLIDEQAGSLHQADDVTAVAIASGRRAGELRLAA